MNEFYRALYLYRVGVEAAVMVTAVELIYILTALIGG